MGEGPRQHSGGGFRRRAHPCSPAASLSVVRHEVSGRKKARLTPQPARMKVRHSPSSIHLSSASELLFCPGAAVHRTRPSTHNVVRDAVWPRRAASDMQVPEAKVSRMASSGRFDLVVLPHRHHPSAYAHQPAPLKLLVARPTQHDGGIANAIRSLPMHQAPVPRLVICSNHPAGAACEALLSATVSLFGPCDY